MKNKNLDGNAQNAGRHAVRPPADITRLLPLYQTGGSGYFGYRMVLAARMFDRRIIQLLKESGTISLPQWRVISQLGLSPRGTVRTLAEGAAVDRAEVSRALRELSEKGLVKREDNIEDQRSPIFSLSAKGKKMFLRLRKPIAAFIERLVKDVSLEDLEAADRVLWAVTRGSILED